MGERISVKTSMNLFYNFKGHFNTIVKHKYEVMKNCFKAGIYLQGITHDLSKFSPSEFFVGVIHYQGDRSPNEGEREKYGYSKAWMHHKGRNKHHFEYWTDYNINTRRVEPIEMPKKYVIEMFCDRVAASKVYLGKDYTNSAPYEYFDRGRKKRIINDKTSKELEKLLLMLKHKGEEETFKYIRRAVVLGKSL